MRRFELSDGSSSKFWEVAADGPQLTVRFGRIGTNGQTQVKALASASRADAELDKLVREKTRKGYTEVGVLPSRVAAPPPSAPPPHTPTPTAAAAPAPPVAPPPVAPPPVAPPPVASPPAGPAPPAVDAFAGWPRSSVASVLATRGLRAYAPKPVPWSAVVASAYHLRLVEIAEPLRDLHALVDAAVVSAAEPAPLPLEASGILLARAGIGTYQPREATAAVVDRWILWGGFPFAIDALLTRDSAHVAHETAGFALRAGPAARCPGWICPWLRLREHLAWTSRAAYAEALEHAERRVEDATDDARIGLAFAFPFEALAGDLAAVDLPRRHDRRLALALAVPDAAVAAELLGGGMGPGAALWLDGPDHEATYLTLVAMHGPGAEPILRSLARGGTDLTAAEALLGALAMVGVESTFERILTSTGHRLGRACLQDAIDRAPAVAVPVLARHAVAGDGDVSRRACVALAALLAADTTGAARASVDALPEPVRSATLARVSPQGDLVGEADAASLPSVLLSPPSEAPRAPPPAPVQVALVAPVVDESVIGWDSGATASWGHELPGDTEPRRFARVLHDLGVLRDPAQLHTLGEDAGLVLLREAVQTGGVLRRAHIGTGLSRTARQALVGELPPSMWEPTLQMLRQIVAEDGVAAIEVMIRLGTSHPALVVAAMRPLRSARLAPLAAGAFGKKASSAAAREWLRWHPEHATAGLLVPALGRPGPARSAAVAALRWLDATEYRAVVRDVATRVGVADELAAVLGAVPPDGRPARVPTLPDFVQPTTLPRLVLRSGGSIAAAPTSTFATILAMSTLDAPHPGVASVRDACTTESLETFAWALFRAWIVAGAPSKEVWAFTQLAHLGGDPAARELAPLVRKWPGESAHARAVRGLEILAAMGTDVALMHLFALSQKGKFKALLDRARILVTEVATRRNLTPAQLGDRLIPHLGLEPDGTMVLDLGPRSFQVGFDERLHPFVRGADGKRFADLPKPRADDEPARAAEATATWRALKKDVRAIATQQIARLEAAMIQQRRWPADEFVTFIVGHPLLVHLARRIVWGAHDEAGALVTPFRVAEDRSLADAHDEVFALQAGARVGVVHPVELSAAQLTTWSGLLGDYAIIQPFEQLAREVHLVAAGDEASTLDTLIGRVVPSVRIMALEARGWRRGEVWDAGIVRSYEREAVGASIDFEPGLAIGSPGMIPEQTIQDVRIGFGRFARGRIAASEALRDLALLVP